MEFQYFPVALMVLSPRVTRTGDPASSVDGINTTTLADGALAFCQENRQTYRLQKDDDSTPPDGNVVIAPLAGPGRWIMYTGGPPTGPAGGDLAGTYPDPLVVALEETSTPARLAIAGVPDGTLLGRSGTDVVGVAKTAVGDHKVNVDGTDTTPGFLTDKLGAGSNISFTIINPGANEKIIIAAVVPPGSSDHKVLVDGADTTAAFLGAKLAAGANVALTVLNPGGNEQVEISVSGAPPTGAAGGDLGSTYPNPTVVAIEETSTPARLAIAGVPDGTLLSRSGLTVVGVTASSIRDGGLAQASKFQTNTFATNGAGGAWKAVTGSDFTYSGSADFSLTPAGAMLTYNGTSGRSFLVTYTLGLSLASGTSVETAGAIVSKNGDHIGGAIFNDASAADGAMFQTSVVTPPSTIAQSQEGYALDQTLGTTLSITVASPLTPGSVLLVHVTNDTVAASNITVADSVNVGNYTAIDDVNNPAQNQRLASFYFKNNQSSGTPTITATWDVPRTSRGIHYQEILHADTVAPLAGHAAQFQLAPGTGADGATSGNTAPLTGQPALVCGLCQDAAANATPSAGTGFTSGTSGWRFPGEPADEARSETKRVTTSSAVAATFTMGANESSVTSAAVFLEADATTSHISLTVQRRVTLNNGDTLRPLGAKQLGNADLLIDSLSVTVLPQ